MLIGTNFKHEREENGQAGNDWNVVGVDATDERFIIAGGLSEAAARSVVMALTQVLINAKPKAEKKA